jgi:phosphoglycerate dehydrogenase-like enzyme
MSDFTEIAMLDDDHVIRLTRYALSRPGEVAEQWVRDFFLPEEVDPAILYEAGEGLHKDFGIRVIPMSEKVDVRNGSDASILILRRGVVDHALISANPKLKFIQRIGERSDGIDLKAAAQRGIVVSCSPRRTQQYTAEHAILLMLALSKNLLEADRAVRVAQWDRDRVHPENGIAYNWTAMPNLGGLFGATVGIIGMGEIGSMAAIIARGFGARVIYCNRNRLQADQEARIGAEWMPLSQLLVESDHVSVHAQNLPENKGMIGADTFARMKKTAFFINTSRGRMVDEDALYLALTNGDIAGAGLDVHYDEPRPASSKLISLKNVVMTPHLAAGSRTGVFDEVLDIVGNCHAALAGKAIRYQVKA